MAAAQTAVTAAGKTCQVTEAKRLGTTGEDISVYEAGCATGPGYLIVASAPPVANDCVLLAASAERLRAADPAADVGTQCSLPVNMNALPVFAGYARDAGVTCTVDQGRVVGQDLYEVGCGIEPGYWVEKAEGNWKKTPCWEVVERMQQQCTLTTLEEGYAAWKPLLAGTEFEPCDVNGLRGVGIDAQQRSIYELKCATGEGFFVRMNDQYLVLQTVPCAQARNIGGGCSLTAARED